MNIIRFLNALKLNDQSHDNNIHHEKLTPKSPYNKAYEYNPRVFQISNQGDFTRLGHQMQNDAGLIKVVTRLVLKLLNFILFFHR